jgi:hypothetical protein
LIDKTQAIEHHCFGRLANDHIALLMILLNNMDGLNRASDEMGPWTRVGIRKTEATALNVAHSSSNGAFAGTAVAHYILGFDKGFQNEKSYRFNGQGLGRR